MMMAEHDENDNNGSGVDIDKDSSNDNDENMNSDNGTKLHISRVPTTFNEDVVQRILETKLGSKDCVAEVTLIYPRDEENDDEDGKGNKTGTADDGTEGAGEDTGETAGTAKSDDEKVHRGFGFVTLSTSEWLQKALKLQTIRGGRKPTSSKKHTMYLRPYHDPKESKYKEGGDANDVMNICYLWQQNRCPYGDDCKFTHSGPGGCREIPSSKTSTKKRQKCFTYKKTGKCKRGDDCPFSHDFVPNTKTATKDKERDSNEDHDESTSASQPQNQAKPKSEKDCINWKTKGKCRKRDKCPYRHDVDVQKAALAKLKKKEKNKKRRHDGEGGFDQQHDSSNKKQKQPLSVRVFGLNYDSKEDDVRDLFKDCGKIMEITFPTFEDSGRSKGYCCVLFTSPKAVTKAVELDGCELHGRWLRIQVGKMYLRQWEQNHEKQRQDSYRDEGERQEVIAGDAGN